MRFEERDNAILIYGPDALEGDDRDHHCRGSFHKYGKHWYFEARTDTAYYAFEMKLITDKLYELNRNAA